jgi:hypothetical protein
MRNQKIPEKSDDADIQKMPSALWNVFVWALALGAFAMALVLSYRGPLYNSPNDLRTPAVLLVDALLATAVAVGFAVRECSLTRWTDAQFCLRFGLWAAAVFRLVPTIINEEMLFFKGELSFDLPFIALGACVHGGLALVLACPYATRVLDRPAWSNGESLWKMCGAVILVFFVVTCVVRLLAENWWLGFH